MKTYFITGTDTSIGKTTATCQLMRQLKQSNKKVIALKPIASGTEYICPYRKPVHQDSILLQQAANVLLEYQTINPYLMQEAIAPHISASKNNDYLDADAIFKKIAQTIEKQNADYCFIEGAGGWLLPLNNKNTFAEVIVKLNLPIIMVVGIKLGCLNHSLLTYNSIKSLGGNCIGWIANCIDPNMQCMNENIDSLKELLEVKCIGKIPYNLCAEQAEFDFTLLS